MSSLPEAFIKELAEPIEAEARKRLDAAGQDCLISELDEPAAFEAWPEGCPMRPSELRGLDFRFLRVNGDEGCGRLVLPARFSAAAIAEAGGLDSSYREALDRDPAPRPIAEEAAAILARLYRSGALILDRAIPLHHLRSQVGGWGEELDQFSMSLNNSSAFHPRPIRDTGRWSRHCVGAIDLNPAFNPLVIWTGPAPAPHADRWTRADLEAGRLAISPEGAADFAFPEPPLDPRTLTGEHAAVAAFRSADWSWGGDWGKLKDRQHFSPGDE